MNQSLKNNVAYLNGICDAIGAFVDPDTGTSDSDGLTAICAIFEVTGVDVVACIGLRWPRLANDVIDWQKDEGDDDDPEDCNG